MSLTVLATGAMSTGISPCVITPIACLPGAGSAISNTINPLAYLQQTLQSLATGSLDLFVNYILYMPGYGAQGSWLDTFDGGLLGLAEVLVVFGILINTFKVLVTRKQVHNLTTGIIVLAGLGAFGVGIFTVLNWIQQVGDQLAITVWNADIGGKPNTHSLLIPPVNNLMGSIIEIAVILIGGILLVQLVAAYSLIIPFFKAMAPIALSLKSMGDRGENFFNWVVAFLMVTLVLGRLLMVLPLRIVMAISEHSSVSDPMATSVGLIAGFLAAFVLNLLALVWAKKSIAPKITGAITGGSAAAAGALAGTIGAEEVRNHALKGRPLSSMGSRPGGSTSPSNTPGAARRPQRGPHNSLSKGVGSMARESLFIAGADKLDRHAASKKAAGVAAKAAGSTGVKAGLTAATGGIGGIAATAGMHALKLNAEKEKTKRRPPKRD